MRDICVASVQFEHADDDIVIADLDASLQKDCTGVRWIRSRRPDLYAPLAKPTGMEKNTRTISIYTKE